jgi:hypothetical protein
LSASELLSSRCPRSTRIKFGDQDIVHSYHRATLGKDDIATHERRAAPHGSSPLASPCSFVQPSLLPEGSNDTRQQEQQSSVTTGSVSPPQFGLGFDGPLSAPAGVGVAGGAYRDPFEGGPASATLPAVPSIISLDDAVEMRRHKHRTYSRPGYSRDYPRGDRVDYAEEKVSLCDPRHEDNKEVDPYLNRILIWDHLFGRVLAGRMFLS